MKKTIFQKTAVLLAVLLVVNMIPAFWLEASAAGGLAISGTDGGYTQDSAGNITITADGTYTISGSSTIAAVKVSAGVTANVTLNDVAIHNSYLEAFVAALGSTVNLTLNGSNTLVSYASGHAGMCVPVGASLTIAGSGSLEARSGDGAAGIGGGVGGSAGTTTITGGTVNVTGGSSAAGIGGGVDGKGGNVTITGGAVNVTGGDGAVGIGGGVGGSAGTTTITGGSVKAMDYSGNIGSQSVSGAVTDGNGYTVYCVTTSTPFGANQAVGASFNGGADFSAQTDSEGKLYFWLPSTASAVAACGSQYGSMRVSGISGDTAASLSAMRVLDIANGSITAADGLITQGSNQYAANDCEIQGTSTVNTISVTGGTHNMVLNGVNIALNAMNVPDSSGCAFNITGNSTVNLTLSGTNKLTSGGFNAGIDLKEGNTVRITGGESDSLEATGGTFILNHVSCGSAGIGGGGTLTVDADGNMHLSTGVSGDVTISGGTVTASGGLAGAGIGGGNGGKGGNVTITGGMVNANGGGNGGAGIGSGSGSSAGTITITGGMVNANGGTGGAGIGGNGGNITINGGTVTATGRLGGAGIGGDAANSGCNITITGGSVHATGGDSAAGIGGGNGGRAGTTTITGGSVNASSIQDTPTNGTDPVDLTTITLPAGQKVSALAITQGGSDYSYGFTDMQADSSGRLYLYLPANSSTTANVTADGNRWNGYHGAVNSGQNQLKMDQAALTVHVATTYSYGDAVTPTASGGSGSGAVSYSYTGQSGTAYGPSSTAPTNPGDYSVTATKNADDSYYAAASAAQTFTIVQRTPTLTFTASPSSSFYGDTVTFTATLGNLGSGTPTGQVTFVLATGTGSVNAVTELLDSSGRATFSASAWPAGMYPISATYTGDTNYTDCGGNYSYTVSPAAQSLTFPSGDVTKAYGDAPFTAAATHTKGDGEITYASDHPEIASVNSDTGMVTIHKAGNATITATAAATTNYTQTTASYNLTVNPKVLTVQNPAATGRLYDGTDTVQLTGTLSGVVGSDEVTLGGSGTAASKAAGTQAVTTAYTLGGTDAGNYTVTQPTDLTVVIAPVTLTAAAQDANRLFGENNPAFSVDVTGFVHGESPSTLSGYIAPTASCSAASGSATGTYAIVPSGGTPTGNYIFAYVNGTLTVGRNSIANGTDYTVTTPNGQNGWFKTNGTFSILPAGRYDQISTSETGGWVNRLDYSTDTAHGSVTFYLRNSGTGAISKAATETYKLDQTAPTGSIHIATNTFTSFLNTITFGLFFKETQTVTIAGQDATSSVASVQYQTVAAQSEYNPGGTWTAYPAGGFSLVPDSKYIVYAKITDNAGNYTILNSDGVIVDQSKPALSLTAPTGWQSGDVTVAVSAGDALAGLQSVTYTTNEPTPQTGAVALDASGKGSIALHNEGSYTLTVTATDKAGNAFTQIVPVQIDKTAPVITAQSSLTTTDPGASIPVNVKDAGSGVGRIRYQINGGTVQTIDLTTGAPTDYSFTIANLPDGVYDVTIQAQDNSGNAAQTVTVHVNKNGSPQVTGVTVTPATATLHHGDKQTFTAAVSTRNGAPAFVVWSVSGNTSAKTVIDSNGNLTVAADEAAKMLTVTATSGFDRTKSAQATVQISTSAQSGFGFDTSSLTKTYGDAPFAISARGGQGTGAITYAVTSGNDVVSISGSMVTVKKAGSAVITATKAASGSFEQASATLTLTVNKAATTIKTLPAASAIEVQGLLFSSALTGGTGSVNGSFAWTAPDTLVSSSGSYSVTFTPADTADYLPCTGMAQVTVNKVIQSPTGIRIDTSGATFPADVTSVSLGSSTVPQTGTEYTVITRLIGNNLSLGTLSGLTVYEIELLDQNGNPIPSFAGMIRIKLPIPSGMHGRLHVYWYDPVNCVLTDMNAVQEGDDLVFKTSHCSKYAIAELQTTEPSSSSASSATSSGGTTSSAASGPSSKASNPNTGSAFPALPWILLGASAAGGFVVWRKRRSKPKGR